MVIEEALVAEIKADAGVAALMGARLYPLFVPEDATLPAAAYQRISGPRQHSHAGPTGLASLRVQVTCIGSTYAAAKGLANAIRAAIDGHYGLMGGVNGVFVHHCSTENELDGYNQTAGRATVRLDFLIWHNE